MCSATQAKLVSGKAKRAVHLTLNAGEEREGCCWGQDKAVMLLIQTREREERALVDCGGREVWKAGLDSMNK